MEQDQNKHVHSSEVEVVAPVTTGTDLTVAGTTNIDQLKNRIAQMKAMIEIKRDFLRDVLEKGIDKDYGEIPGCGDKKVLLKPGAEKLLDWHGYYASFLLMSEVEDWDSGLFAYVYRCEVKQKGSGIIVGVSEGDASTMESKYRFEWKYANNLPAGVDPSTLKSRAIGRGEQKSIQYQVLIDNPADKRNTVRKMAQKRALIGATVLATATSALFTTDIDPDEVDTETGEVKAPEKPTGGEGASTTPKDYGNPISEKQGKRLWAIRSNAKIDPDLFKKWLKAKYGYDHDNEIGWKAYEEICKACESGKLEMPVEKPPEQTKPEQAATPAAAAGAKLNSTQIKSIWDAIINETKSDEEAFLKFLHENYPQYAPKGGINDILSAECDSIRQAFIAKMKQGAA